MTVAAANPGGLMALLKSVFDQTGLDFRHYAMSSLKRRIQRQVVFEGLRTVDELHGKVIADGAVLNRLVSGITVHVTSLFRDPGFFRAFREQAGLLRTYPYLRFWIAGCSSGEEVYSLAILLQEEGLYARSRIYATDLSPAVLERAKAGVYPLSAMQDYTRNYQKSGGTRSFAEYYLADNENALLRPYLRDNVVFAAHNLAADASFNEFHAIFCRNVMIYFDQELQNRVHRLIHGSLLNWGYLGLGRSESVRFSPLENAYEPISVKDRLYRKIA